MSRTDWEIKLREEQRFNRIFETDAADSGVDGKERRSTLASPGEKEAGRLLTGLATLAAVVNTCLGGDGAGEGDGTANVILADVRRKNREIACGLGLSPDEYSQAIQKPDFKEVYSLAKRRGLTWAAALAELESIRWHQSYREESRREKTERALRKSAGGWGLSKLDKRRVKRGTENPPQEKETGGQKEKSWKERKIESARWQEAVKKNQK